jgi:CheY-like chemotaxis protein
MRSLLVVDDDDDIRETLTELLTQSGRHVFGAATGAEALQLLDGSEVPRPCLILLDWRMQPMGGQEFLTSLYMRSDVSQLPVVIVSADSEAPRVAAAPGVVATLAKPFDIDTLENLLQTYG